MPAIVISDFRSTDHVLEAARVESSYFSAAEEPVFHNPVKLPCDFILFGCRQPESGGLLRAEQLKSSHQCQVCCEDHAQRNWGVRQLVSWKTGEETGDTHSAGMGKASKWCSSMWRLQSRARLRVQKRRWLSTPKSSP